MRYQLPSHVAATSRKGVVLLVVMAMLTLFAALGISFVFYADAMAVASQAGRASLSKDQADIDPELLSAYFLNQLVYGTNNPYSSMQGHSFADTIYGSNPAALNHAPFNGLGRQPYPIALAGGLDNVNLLNYTKFESPIGTLADGFQRIPGFNSTTNTYIEGTNVPWTAADRNTAALAVVTAKGEVLLPSFFRPWTGVNPADTAAASKHRYLTLRPHASWHPQFSPPDSESITGTNIRLDVKNNEFGLGFRDPNTGTMYNNDSIWMDLGFPIMTAPDGRRYRPLFAPMVVDLSNRLHLWLHGNNSAAGGAHASLMGMGVSEVNIGKVIPAGDLAKVFAMRQAITGAPKGMPSNGPWHSRFDQDAIDAANAVTTPFAFPTTSAAGNFHPFPVFPATGWDNNATEAVVGKPLGRNIFTAATRPMSMLHMEWLLRYGGTNTPATPSELARQLGSPGGTLNDPTDPQKRRRNMLTLWSAHLDRINAVPVIAFNPYAAAPPPGSPQYSFGGVNPYPTLTPAQTPINFATPPATLPVNSEYNTADWRSVLAGRLRVNLNRTFVAYPATDATGAIPVASFGVYENAVNDRRAMAKEIYEALVRVTGAQDPNSGAAWAKMPTDPTYKAARWLAQLALNIVDYTDPDDYSTTWEWYPGEWIFGTELPRLVINEVYAQADNDNKGNGKGTPKGKAKGLTRDVNVWAELHNPFFDTPIANTYPQDGGVAKLVINGNPVYQLVLTPTNAALSAYLLDPDNHVGDLDAASLANATIVTDWAATPANPVSQEVLPAKGAFTDATNTNKGFYVIGPPANYDPPRNPNLAVTHISPFMSINYDNTGVPGPMTIVLRRLAVPHMPPNNTPGAGYNPYITVDYMNRVAVNDGRQTDDKGNALAPLPVTDFVSQGRMQPYAGHLSQIRPQDPASFNVKNGQPKHTFYRHNSREDTLPLPAAYPAQTLTFPFDWLTHLDRPLVNPLELLLVSGYKQHELTQRFIVGATPADKFKHVAPWTQQDAMIYRVLDLLMTPNQLAGTIRGGMHPGMINLNTITEEEILQALCDPNSTAFNAGDVSTIFQNLIASRHPVAAAGQPLQPASDGNPFRTFGAANLAETWARPVFDLPTPTHPYQKSALLQKIYNNITTTSNVFAVWWTVGYFEVVDESVRPARLGQEIGRSENRHIRHRFFAIIDRSALQLYSSTVTAPAGTGVTATMNPASLATKTGTAAPWNATQTYALSNAVTTAAGAYICIQPNVNKDPATNPAFWQPALQPGMLLEMGGVNPEVVLVKTVPAAGTFTADFAFTHAAGTPMILRGNPGPQAIYNPHRDTSVILHLSVIK